MPPAESFTYDHTQQSRSVILIVLLFMMIVGVVTGSLLPGETPDSGEIVVLFIVWMMLIWMLLTMRKMRVEVAHRQISVTLGTGWPKRVIPVKDIVSCQKVRNSPPCGWGIRYIGNGWMFNIDGLDAVELKLKNGRRFRIGTDEPDKLLAAIEEQLR